MARIAPAPTRPTRTASNRAVVCIGALRRVVVPALIGVSAVALLGSHGRASIQPPTSVRGSVVIEGLDDAAGTIVWLERLDAETPTVDATATLDQHGLDFEPGVLVVAVATVVEFRNSDTVLHNIFAPGPQGETFDLGTWPAGESRSFRFDRPGITTVLCNVHPEMEAYIIAIRGTHWGRADADGSFAIQDVPAGRYALHAWHQRCEEIRTEVTVQGDADTVVEVSMRLGRPR